MKASQRLSAVFLALAVHQWCTETEKKGLAVEAASGLLAVAVVAVVVAMQQHSTKNTSFSDAASLFVCGACLSPVLGSLTRTYSSDTVTVLTRLSLALHLLAFDSPVALNAGFSAMLLMASRLESSLLVFAFAATCTALLFSLPQADIGALNLAFATASVVAFELGKRWFVFYVFSAWLIGVYCPALLRREQVVHLRGKWDLLHVEEEEETGVMASGFMPTASPSAGGPR